MKFWTTGRIDTAIIFESFHPVMLSVERQINLLISEQDYGDLIESFDIIINIFQEEPSEKFWYIAKSRETNIDVNVDHDQFINADEKGRIDLYLKAILKAIDKLRGNKKLAGFNFSLFYDTVRSLLSDSK